MIPESTFDDINAWISTARPVGGFLEAVLCNDLRESFARADEYNQKAMFEIVSWLYNYAPCNCWGSEKAYRKWKGLGKP